MLYNPPHFQQSDVALMHADIAATGFASLITVADHASGGAPLVSHAPLIWQADGSEHGALIGHLARANMQWNHSDLTKPAVAVFMGPDAYVSPSWYLTKPSNPRVVPTWNYAVVHVRGTLEVFEEPGQVMAIVTALTEKHEQRVASQWQVTDAPPDFMERQLRGIVGVRLKISAFEGKRKLSQNRVAGGDAGNVAATLARSDSAADRALASAMQELPGAK
jgi:transcriptional regulator